MLAVPVDLRNAAAWLCAGLLLAVSAGCSYEVTFDGGGGAGAGSGPSSGTSGGNRATTSCATGGEQGGWTTHIDGT